MTIFRKYSPLIRECQIFAFGVSKFSPLIRESKNQPKIFKYSPLIREFFWPAALHCKIFAKILIFSFNKRLFFACGAQGGTLTFSKNFGELFQKFFKIFSFNKRILAREFFSLNYSPLIREFFQILLLKDGGGEC